MSRHDDDDKERRLIEMLERSMLNTLNSYMVGVREEEESVELKTVRIASLMKVKVEVEKKMEELLKSLRRKKCEGFCF